MFPAVTESLPSWHDHWLIQQEAGVAQECFLRPRPPLPSATREVEDAYYCKECTQQEIEMGVRRSSILETWSTQQKYHQRRTMAYWVHYFNEQLFIDPVTCARPIEHGPRAKVHPDGPQKVSRR
ncbi:hypothetical protein R1sor_018775 [Riccia sorocarpa]|uniref:Uncharacterized protein n=1 Tax=Riccia sorocarpa TaxID=122646 RepID=A0ABD3IAQ2_9MARC